MIKTALDKQALEELGQLNIYVRPGEKGGKPKVITRKFKEKEAPGQIATKAVGRAAMGGAMAGGLPFAFLGLQPSGEKTPFFSKGRSMSELADLEKGSPAAKEFIKKIKRTKKGIRALALGGALAGAGSALYKPIKDKLKEGAARMSAQPQSLGKPTTPPTSKIPNPPGKSLGKSAVDPTKSIKDVLEKQAALEAAQL